MNEMKTNTGKLLVAVMALAVVFAGVAVVFSDSEVNAAETMPGSTPTADTVVDLKYPVTSGNINYTDATNPVKITVNYEATANGAVMFSGIDIAVGNNVTLILNMTASSAYTGCHILMDVDLKISGNGVVELKQSSNAGGQSWWDSTDTTDDTLEMSDSSKLVFNGANGFSGVKVTTTGTSSIEFKSTTSPAAAMNFAKDSRIGEGTSVTVDDSKAFIQVGGNTTVEGTIDVGSSKIVIPAKITLNNTKTGKVSASEITGDGAVENDGGKIDAKVSSSVAYPDRDITSNITLGDNAKIDKDSAVIASSNQGIIIDGDVTIVDGGYFTVNGKLTINEGASLTIQKGGYVNIGSTGTVDIQGDLIIEAGTGTPAAEADNKEAAYTGNSFNYKGCGMNVAGSVTLEGANSFNSEGTGVVISGLFEVGESATASFKGAEITETGELTILGAVTTGSTVTNNGTITVDSQGIPNADGTAVETKIDMTVQLGATGTVDAINVFGKITVNDDGLKYTVNKVEKPAANNSAIVLENVAGVVVSENLDTEKGTATMLVSGSVNYADNYTSDNETGTITVSAGETSNIEIAEATTLGEGVTLTIEGKLTVSAEMNATAAKNVIKVASGGTLTVTGKITTDGGVGKVGETEIGTVNAAQYDVQGTSNVIYTTLQTALADNITNINLLGANTITADTTIPVGTTVKMQDNSTLTINKDVTLTVASDDRKSGKLNTVANDCIIVNGTLVLENQAKSGTEVDHVLSDTSKTSGDSVTFTNVYKALADAVDGETVKITRGEKLTLTEDVEVKTGVTLQIPSDEEVEVTYGVTVTVNGTVDVEGTYTIVPALEEDNKDTADVDESVAGATVVNGKFQYQDSADKAEYLKYIVGAYFDYDGKNTIMPLESVPAIADDLESDVELYGDMDLGAIDFTAYTGSDLTVTAYNKLTVDIYTVGGTTFVAGDGSCVNGTIVLANGSVVLSNVNGITAADSTDAEGTVTSAVQGTVKPYDDNDAKTTDKGTVSFTGSVSSSATYNENVAVSVPTGATLIVTGGSFKDLTVQGTLEGKANFSVEKAVISGTVNMAEKMTLTATTLYAGVTVETVDDVDYITSTTDAAINGGISATTAYFGPSVTVPESFTDSANSYKNTAYYVEGDLYVSAYTTAKDVSISKIGVDLDIADFKGWMDKDGKAASGVIGSLKEVYANLDYNICEVTISTLPGATIYIDGQPYDGGKISVGEHNISVYVKPGYTGEPQITVNGQAVENGGTFTASADAPTQISVSGITTGNYSGGDDSGMGLTEILLIILVVLIVIMAIMVALRLMRS